MGILIETATSQIWIGQLANRALSPVLNCGRLFVLQTLLATLTIETIVTKFAKYSRHLPSVCVPAPFFVAAAADSSRAAILSDVSNGASKRSRRKTWKAKPLCLSHARMYVAVCVAVYVCVCVCRREQGCTVWCQLRRASKTTIGLSARCSCCCFYC